MKEFLFVLIAGALLALIIILGIWYEMTLWDECRKTNSALYCLRVLGN